MSILEMKKRQILAVGATSLLLVACAAPPSKPDGAEAVRSKLTQLQSDPQLASLAPVAIKEAEAAVQAAERPYKDIDQGLHLVWIADRKVDIAAALAESRLLEDQRKGLSEQRETARLDSRTIEADIAINDATEARLQTADLQRQLDALNAKETERGMVITLGDVLFDTGRSELKSGSMGTLSKLAAFLNQHADRTVVIEGHTDTVGSQDFNMSLSQRRADSVKAYLISQGVNPSRAVTFGKGEDTPVASNDTADGRQQNRRVEVIITNLMTSSR